MSNGVDAGIAISYVVAVLILASGIYWYRVAGCGFGSGREEREREMGEVMGDWNGGGVKSSVL